MGSRTLKLAIMPTAVLIIAAIMFVPSLLQAGEMLSDSVDALDISLAEQQTIVFLKPGQTGGSITSDVESPEGYSDVSILYSFNLINDGDGGCKSTRTHFQMTGFPPTEVYASCNEDDIVSKVKEKFEELFEKSHKSTIQKMIDIERYMADKFTNEIPQLLKSLKY